MEIHPNKGVGPIRFGMTVEEVRRVMGCKPTPFRKSPQSAYETDSFNDTIHVYYRSPGVCDAIECFPPAEVTYQSNRFFERAFAEVREWLLNLDPQAKIEADGLTSFLLGIALYAPAIKAPEEPIEAVLVFEEGYYDCKRS